MTPITLSRRQAKAADRLTGALLMLPWPPELARPEKGAHRGATLTERSAALARLSATCADHHLTIHDVTVGWPQAHGRDGADPYICIYVAHERWPRQLDNERIADQARWLWLSPTA